MIPTAPLLSFEPWPTECHQLSTVERAVAIIQSCEFRKNSAISPAYASKLLLALCCFRELWAPISALRIRPARHGARAPPGSPKGGHEKTAVDTRCDAVFFRVHVRSGPRWKAAGGGQGKKYCGSAEATRRGRRRERQG